MNWRRLLGWRWLPAAAIALGVALCLPSLGNGLVADDWIQKIIAAGNVPELTRRPLDLFTFADGNHAHAMALVDRGYFPWWTDPDVKLAFFRPLTALTHVADWKFWPASPWLMHAQSLLWLLFACASVAFVFRRVLAPSWLAGLATLLYAIDHTHGPAVSWVANRNSMIAVALGMPAVALHDRWRREQWRPAAWLAPLSLAAGLLAGESAIAVIAFLVAYAVTLDEAPLGARAISLWPYALVAGAWQLAYHRLGYGAACSGVYLDPAADTIDFLRALPARATEMLVGQFALPPSDLTPLWELISPRLARLVLAWSVVVVVALGWLVWPTLTRKPAARFFALALLLATLPICATFPADRLLFFVSIGACGLLAVVIGDELRGARRVGVWMLVALHVFLAPPLLAVRSRTIRSVARPLELADRTIPATPDVTDKTVVLMNPPAEVFAGYVQPTRAGEGVPRPHRLRWLATGADGVELTREDARTLRVRQLGGFNRNIFERMLRSPHHPLTAGQTIDVEGMRVVILSRDEARLTFEAPLDDASFVWLRWENGRGYLPAAPPRVGETMTLPPIDVVAATFPPGAKKR